MYAVSEEYKRAIESQTRTVALAGEITLSNGAIISFDDRNVLTGSVSLSEQAVAGTDIEIGNVYMSEFKITFINSTFSQKHNFDKAVIRPVFSILIDDEDRWESVPLGVFHVVDPEKSYATTALTCYDNMLVLNETREDKAVTGTVYEILKYIEEDSGIELSNSESEIETFVNAQDTIMVPSAFDDIISYRDLIGFLVQLLACFAIIDRDGRLKLIRMKKDQVVRTIDTDRRLKTTISDYVTGVSRLEMRLEDTVLVSEDGSFLGNRLELPFNPLFAQGDMDYRRQRLDNMLEEISQVRYMPCNVRFVGDPALQPGDWLSYTNGVADAPVESMLTHSLWKYRGDHQLQAVGKNPAIKESTDNNVSLPPSQIIQLTDYYYNYENLGDVTFNSNTSDLEIITILFSSSVDNYAFFHATINVEITDEAEEEGLLEFSYSINNVTEAAPLPKQTVPKGHHIIHLYLPIQVMENRSYLFRAYLKSNTRGVIPARHIQATINGQGLYAQSVEWNGIITVSDFHEGFKLERKPLLFGTHSTNVRTDIIDPLDIDLKTEWIPLKFNREPLVLGRHFDGLEARDVHYLHSEYQLNFGRGGLSLGSLTTNIEMEQTDEF
ncbi:hypothetical protein [Enterococcus sp.]|uniref:hypothetical protein n=1 Tax=Enterococcus sp. TaxID=35783 RepID=UPI002899B088|nr:hypothetical protein [Enterococcus sp.]